MMASICFFYGICTNVKDEKIISVAIDSEKSKLVVPDGRALSAI
jgi:hypothetical protein